MGLDKNEGHNAMDQVSGQAKGSRGGQGTPVLTNDGLSPEELSDLGLSRVERFCRSGLLKDLEEAVEYGNRALALTPDGHPDLVNRHSNLGISYSIRSQRLGELGDIEKAIEHLTRALALTSEGHPDLSRLHANLGVSYTDRFQRLGELVDLEQAIECRKVGNSVICTYYGICP